MHPRLHAATLVLSCLVALPAAAQSLARHGGDVSRPAPLPPKPEATMVTDGHIPGVIEVKFEHGRSVRLRDGLFVEHGAVLEDVMEVLASRGATPRRMFMQSEEWLAQWRASGEARSGIALHDLNLFYFVDVPSALAGTLCDELNALDGVTLAWPAPSGGDPVVAAGSFSGSTPNFAALQEYKNPAPTGIDAAYGNDFSGGRGIGITIADCETGWTDDHEDLAGKLQGNFVGFTPAPYPWDHGTAVMGELMGEKNGFGILGICHEAEGLMSTHSPVGQPQNIPGSVANGAAAVGPGDFVVIEIQCFGAVPAPFPCEYDPPIFSTVQTATANGIHVMAAAGNGDNDLDSPVYGGAFDLDVQDSGAVMVGASDGVLLSKASFSNYGSRCTSSGWGWDVATAGYGDLWNGPSTEDYTDVFSGTSSATPIVTGAAVILASMHRQAFGFDIDPLDLRDLLATTGTPQTSGGQIGSRPDLRAAIAALGIPRIELGGDWMPGGTIEVTSFGDAGDTYLLGWSLGLLPDPGVPLPPWGILLIDPGPMAVLPVQGVIGAGGSTTDVYNIPSNPGLSGMTTYFQEVQVFNTKPGTGSFSNFARWRFP